MHPTVIASIPASIQFQPLVPSLYTNYDAEQQQNINLLQGNVQEEAQAQSRCLLLI